MNFKEFKTNIEKGLNAKSDYQKRVLCYLLNNGKTPKIELAKMLNDNHRDMNKTYSHFMGCTVWNVLTNKGMIRKIQDSYDITIKPNQEQQTELIQLCKMALKDKSGYLSGKNQWN